MDERRGANDEGESEEVRELRTMADTVREALLDASVIAHGDELLRLVGLAEIAACLTRLEPSARRTVWNMQPRVQYDPHDPGPALTEASQRRGVETVLVTRPATLLTNPLLPSLYPGTRVGPVFLRALVVDRERVLVVDDVADSGKTLELVTDFCRDHVAEARSAVLYEKPRTVVDADYVWRRTDRWIDFPWSS